MSLASDERTAICDEFTRLGPDRPTLCAGWTSRDLLAHLLVRERQPWVAPGLVISALSPLVERATAGYAATPWSEMVEALRSGPPSWSPFRVGKVDEFANGVEFFVHHEDLRRGEPGWEPRPPDPARDGALWKLLQRMGGMLYRRSPVGVALRRPSGERSCVTTVLAWSSWLASREKSSCTLAVGTPRRSRWRASKPTWPGWLRRRVASEPSRPVAARG